MSNWVLLLIAGIISLIGGLLAFFNPFAASLAASVLAAWFFLVAGGLQFFQAFQSEGWGGRIWSAIIGVLSFVVGINLLTEPLAGVVALTMATGILFAASGIFKIIVGFRVRKTEFKWLVILSGVASLILAFIMLANFPESAAFSLGILLGAQLLSDGIAAIMLALSRNAGGISDS